MELKAIQLTKQYGSKTAVKPFEPLIIKWRLRLADTNGAGKTTLMRLLCDIQTPTSGKITLDGKNISVLGEKYVIYWDIYRNSLDIIQTLQLGFPYVCCGIKRTE